MIQCVIDGEEKRRRRRRRRFDLKMLSESGKIFRVQQTTVKVASQGYGSQGKKVAARRLSTGDESIYIYMLYRSVWGS